MKSTEYKIIYLENIVKYHDFILKDRINNNVYLIMFE